MTGRSLESSVLRRHDADGLEDRCDIQSRKQPY